MARCTYCGLHGLMLKTYRVACDLNEAYPYFGTKQVPDAADTCINYGELCETCYTQVKSKEIALYLFEEAVARDIMDKGMLSRGIDNSKTQAFLAWLANSSQYQYYTYPVKLCSQKCMRKFLKADIGVEAGYGDPMPVVKSKTMSDHDDPAWTFSYASFKCALKPAGAYRHDFSEPIILLRESIRDPEILEIFDNCFPDHPGAREKRRREEEVKAGETTKKEKQEKLQEAQEAEKKGLFQRASELYRELEMKDNAQRTGLLARERELKETYTRAQRYEKAHRYKEAARLYEKVGRWGDAGRMRKLLKDEEKDVTQQYIAEKIDLSSKTEIKDSIIQRSKLNLPGNAKIEDSVLTGKDDTGKRPFSICPYCGKKLNLPETPNFCPYCTKALK